MIRKFAEAITAPFVQGLNGPVYQQWYWRHRKALARFRDLHAGESCFIIGNGPSLNAMDLAPLRDRVCFGLNKIHLLMRRVAIEIDYHVSINRFVIAQCKDEFDRLECPSFVSWRAGRKVLKPKPGRYFIMPRGDFEFSRDLQMGVSEGYTVTYVALQIAYYMGFREVYLIGVDHRFQTDGSPNETQLLSGPDPNHFDPAYFGNQSWQLPDLEASELAFHHAKFAFNRDGRQVYDATVNGELEIFPKLPYEEALRRTIR